MKSLKRLLSTVILWLLIGGLLIINISWGEGVITYNYPSFHAGDFSTTREMLIRK